jgi:hypothetical protein
LTQFQLTHWVVYGLNYYMMAKAAYGEDSSCVQSAFVRIFGPDATKAQEFYREVKQLVQSAGPCHIPYPRSLLNRTLASQYEHIDLLARELLVGDPNDAFRQGLSLWTQYMLKFKSAFDNYQKGQDVLNEIQTLQNWAHRYADKGVFVIKYVDMLLDRWRARIKAGLSWYHYNLDWEDEYIRKHDEVLNGPQVPPIRI